MKILGSAKFQVRYSLTALAMSFAIICPAGAAVLFDNTLDSSIGDRSLVPTAQFQSFSNGAGSFSLTDVKVVLNGNNTDNGSLSVGLFSDSSTSPGGLLDHIGSLSDSSLTANCDCIYDFPVLPFALTANTRYWIGLSTSNGSSANWAIEGPFLGRPLDVGVTGEFIDDSGNVYGGPRRGISDEGHGRGYNRSIGCTGTLGSAAVCYGAGWFDVGAPVVVVSTEIQSQPINKCGGG
jgi:hypothetical protein